VTNHAALAPLEERLDSLARSGATAWDGPGVQLVRRLLDAAAGADAELCAHLAERAERHLDRLAQAFSGGRARAEANIQDLLELGVADAESLRAKLASGALLDLQRLRRRHRRRRQAEPSVASRRDELEARATARGITSPGTLESPSAELLAETLYRDALAGVNASLVLVRAAASLPEHAGHYNPVRVAGRALEALSNHPAYLRAQLARLEVVALLQELKTAGNGSRPQRRSRERPST
jgi:hypothetical protein